jgi:protein SCO1/2
MTAAPRFTFLPGTDLGGEAAPAFRLTDHRGVSIGLEDFRGRPVVLAFLYSNCPDVCRLTGAGLRQTLEQLGPDAKNVQLLAVTVDPSGDDAASVRRFLGRYNLADRLLYLTGPAESLPTVWQDYNLFVNVERGQPKEAQLDAHTDALFVLDKQGRERTLLRSDFDPDELATGLRALIAE